MAGFLLDTNVVSQLVNPRADPNVLSWIAARPLEELHISTITVAELWRGVARLEPGRRREWLAWWILDQLPARLAARTLTFDRAAALVWGELMGRGDRAGRPLPLLDAQIAAIAVRNGLTLATCNIADFRYAPVAVVDPRDAV